MFCKLQNIQAALVEQTTKMKSIVLVVLSYAVALNAYPYGLDTGLGIRQLVPGVGAVGQGIGSGIGSGLGLGVGSGIGLGIHGAQALGNGILGVGLGAAQLGTGLATGLGSGLTNGLEAGLGLGGIGGGSRYSQGSGYGGQGVNTGVNADGSNGYNNAGNNGYHNRGEHHASVTSITRSEQNDGQDVGAHNAYNNGAHSNGLVNKYLNGAGNYGSNYGEGVHNPLYN